MPPHHPLLGHLPLIASTMSKLPKDVHPMVLPHQIRKAMPDLGPLFYLDAFPFGPPILIVSSPESAYQITQSHSLPKSHTLGKFVRPMTGGKDLVSMEGQEWRIWRNIFNPGFSTGHLMTLIPEMMAEISTFHDILQGLAGKPDMFFMDPLTTKLSLDIIGRLAL